MLKSCVDICCLHPQVGYHLVVSEVIHLWFMSVMCTESWCLSEKWFCKNTKFAEKNNKLIFTAQTAQVKFL